MKDSILMSANDTGDSSNLDLILPALKAGSKKQAYQLIVKQIASLGGLDEKELLQHCLKNEERASSGIGRGVAIPHLRVKNLKRSLTVLACLTHRVDFQAFDDNPVDLIFFLLSPESDGPYHLRRLARISRVCRDSGTCQALREAEGVDEMRAILINSDDIMMAA